MLRHHAKNILKYYNYKMPSHFLAQFMGHEAPYNSLDNICQWVAGIGFKGIQIPTWDSRYINLQSAAESKVYADELKRKVQF